MHKEFESAELKIWLLGGFKVQVGSIIIDDAAWRLRRARHLVSLLALTPGHRLHQEQIMDAFWPDLTSKAAANNLRGVLYFARRLLSNAGDKAAEHLQRQDNVIILSPSASIWIDIKAFQATVSLARQSGDYATYEDALQRYQGDLLPDDLYEDWTISPRDILRDLHLNALLELAELFERQSSLRKAIDTLIKAIAHDATCEAAHMALMRLYAHSGQPQQALKQYERLQIVLQEELAVDPSPASKTLYEEIQAGKITFDSTAAFLKPESTIYRRPIQPKHNLPQALTTFIGRETELQAIRQHLCQVRLLTLCGMGGSGKTRLAIEVATDLVDDFADGIWLTALDTVQDSSLVPQAVATTINIREEASQSLTQTLSDYIAQRHMLLILDNCEHLIETVSALSYTLLQACPHLKILTTSRQVLGLLGEAIWLVPPLSFPQPAATSTQLPSASDTDIETFEAVQLFLDRARLARPDFSPSEQALALIAQICHQLDGLPLAIELAATRVSTLSIADIADRLQDRFQLLSRGNRAVSQRHRTLEAVIDWSYDLLSPAECLLFNSLSVFVGGWTLHAAEGVGVRPGVSTEHILDLLSRLVERSLVLTRPANDGTVRYLMLETLRQYGLQRLQESDSFADVQQRHAAYFGDLAARAEPQLTGPEQIAWFETLEAEHDNIRAALTWFLKEDSEAGLQLAVRMWGFWQVRGYLTEERRWLEDLLAQTTGYTALRAKATFCAGDLARRQDDIVAALAHLNESLAICRDIGDAHGEAWALNNLGWSAMLQGDSQGAMALLEAALSLARKIDDREVIGWTLIYMGQIIWEQGDFSRATAILEESLTLLQAGGDRQAIGWALRNLGQIARLRGDFDRAQALLEKRVTLSQEIRDRQSIGWALLHLGRVAHAQGDSNRAVRYFEDSLRLLTDLSDKQGMAWVLGLLGNQARIQADYDRAARLIVESLTLLTDLADDQLAGADPILPHCINYAGLLAIAQGDFLHGTLLISATTAINAQFKTGLDPVEKAEFNRSLAAARNALKAADFEHAWADGQRMDQDQAIAMVLDSFILN